MTEKKTALMERLDELEKVIKLRKNRRVSVIIGFSFMFTYSMLGAWQVLIGACLAFIAAAFFYLTARNILKRPSVLGNANIETALQKPERESIEGTPSMLTSLLQGASPATKVSLKTDGGEYKVSIFRTAETEEHDDILKSEWSNGEAYIHPVIFLQHSNSQSWQPFSDFTNNEIGPPKQDYLVFRCMVDSREYLQLNIEGSPKQIPCHYLSPIFYLFSVGRISYIAVEGMIDESGSEIEPIYQKLNDYYFNITSAEFDDIDEEWVPTYS